MKKPNILLISADQMRWDCLGAAGNPAIQTPNLDRLSRRGVLFRNGFTPDPICVPARASIMTGNYPHVCTGSKKNGGRIRDDQPLLTETLKAVGYHTYALGKLHFVPYSPPGEPRLVHGFQHVKLTESGRILKQFDPKGNQRGLEDYIDYLADVGWGGYSRAHGIGNNDVRPCRSPLPPEHHVDHWIADCTIDAIDEHRTERAGQPFFMWMSSPKPHSPYDPPKGYDDIYDPREIPAPFGWGENGVEQQLSSKDPAIDKTRFTHGVDSVSPQAWQVVRAYYYGCITFLDAQIGRVLDHLERTGLLDDTLILFTADHGDLTGDFGSCFKTCHCSGSVRVPFLAAGPGVCQGEVSDALVGLQDILPTFAAVAGAKIKEDVQGVDLTPVFANPAVTPRDTYYATTTSDCGNSVMITDGVWKYVRSEGDGTEELYNLTDDPGEEANLAKESSHTDKLREMREKLKIEARRLGDTDIFDGEDFATREIDRAAFRKEPPTRMGWRWY
ncbi:MAG: sulfatase [Verrucomicrobiota bacterium]